MSLVEYRVVCVTDSRVVLGPYLADDSVSFRVDFPTSGTKAYELQVRDVGLSGVTIEEALLLGMVIKR